MSLTAEWSNDRRQDLGYVDGDSNPCSSPEGFVQLCRVEKTPDGFLIDPTDYLAALPDLTASLPPGAAAFTKALLHSPSVGHGEAW